MGFFGGGERTGHLVNEHGNMVSRNTRSSFWYDDTGIQQF